MSVEDAMPDYLGARGVSITIAGDTVVREGVPFLVEFDYSGASTFRPSEPGSEGVVLPLVLQLISPGGRIVAERVFEDVAPDDADLVTEEGGPHMVRLAERYHNRWFGALVVDVVGDRERVIT